MQSAYGSPCHLPRSRSALDFLMIIALTKIYTEHNFTLEIYNMRFMNMMRKPLRNVRFVSIRWKLISAVKQAAGSRACKQQSRNSLIPKFAV